MIPIRLRVPASRRWGKVGVWAGSLESIPVPPNRLAWISRSGWITRPPIPVGPKRALCPVKATADACHAPMSTGMIPALCEASTIIGTPRWAQRLPMDWMG